MTTAPVHPNTLRVIDHARSLGIQIEPIAFSKSTRTAEEAADAVGVHVRQIVKSLVFAMKSDDGAMPVVALVNGASMCDTAKLSALCDGRRIVRLDADGVRAATGFPIGGVAPFGYPNQLPVFVDDTIANEQVLWAAAGTPHCNMEISGPDLVRASGGIIADLIAAAAT